MMTETRWRGFALLALIVLFLMFWRRSPDLLWVALLAGVGAYLLYRGWQGWSGRGPSREVYWRGRRLDLPPERAGSWARASRATRWSLAGGAALLLTAAWVLVQRIT